MEGKDFIITFDFKYHNFYLEMEWECIDRHVVEYNINNFLKNV